MGAAAADSKLPLIKSIKLCYVFRDTLEGPAQFYKTSLLELSFFDQNQGVVPFSKGYPEKWRRASSSQSYKGGPTTIESPSFNAQWVNGDFVGFVCAVSRDWWWILLGKKQANFNHVHCRKKMWPLGLSNYQEWCKYTGYRKLLEKKGNLGEHFGLDITFGWVPCWADFITIAL